MACVSLEFGFVQFQSIRVVWWWLPCEGRLELVLDVRFIDTCAGTGCNVRNTSVLLATVFRIDGVT